MKTYEDVVRHALALMTEGRYAEAQDLYLDMLEYNQADPNTLNGLATILGTRSPGLGVILLERAVQAMPEEVTLLNNLGCYYRKCRRMEDARKAFRQAISLNNRYAPALANLSGTYINDGQPHLAEAMARKALECDPNFPAAGHHLGLSLLEQCKWQEGFEWYEWRRRIPEWVPRFADVPDWDGSKVRTLLIHGEQGIGDELMFGTIFDEAIDRAEAVVLEVTPHLVPLMQRTAEARWPNVVSVEPSIDAVNTKYQPGYFDAQLPIGSLGRLFRRTDADFEKGQPYLHVPPEMLIEAAAWLRSLGPGPYIGLGWRGGTKWTNVEYRKIPLSEFSDFRREVPATFVSVQYGQCEEEARQNNLPHRQNWVSDFTRLTALIAACDGIVTCCQTAWHQAGALSGGPPVWCLVPSKPAWRYCSPDHRSVWYRTSTFIRQENITGRWEPAITQATPLVADFVKGFH